ncbi:AAA family ATPase [Clostridium butyricum]|uniref:ATP-binding protein n=1 Tax=Clostridium butyricum TaxID=1492 RepID=UPI000B0B29E3|nr:ATP-binding protein [Clostridium butyricum]
MYKAFFGLKFDPFTKEVENKNFFKSNEFNQAMNRLEFLKEHKGFGLITGEPGTGKSSLLRYFKENLNPNLFKCVYIPDLRTANNHIIGNSYFKNKFNLKI